MNGMLTLSFAALLALAAPATGQAGEPQTTGQTARRYVLSVDGMT